MLHTQTVAPQTLGLLKQLEAEPRLAAFNLAGGTALALYLGHRVSVDLDLFTAESFDAGELEAHISGSPMRNPESVYTASRISSP